MSHNLGQTYKEEKVRLLNYIKSRISNTEDAEDILQDVFYKAVRNINVTQPIDNIMGWLFTLTRNRIVDWYRKKRHKTVSFHDTGNGVSFEEMLADTGIQLEKELMRPIVLEAIMECVGELPEEQRKVFLMQVVDGMTFKQISEETGTPINTLIARKRYAVLFLRERLLEIKDLFNEI